MSRIHEALKKAEQERVLSQAAGFAGPPAPPADLNHAVSAPHAAAVAEAPIRPPVESSVPADLLLRCAPAEWKPLPQAALFFDGNDNVRGTEEFRTLRSRLYSIREKMPLKTVLVSSALPKDGKSFTSLNLAQVLVRQHGRRVLLVDGDLRNPRLHSMLGTRPGPGLADYLLGGGDEFAAMQRGPVENLFFMPCGALLENPAELLVNGRLRILMQRLEPLFDWIILDSPPAVPVSDASVMSKTCDGVLLVVRSESTPADVARRARHAFPDEKLIGVVLNGTNRDTVPYTRYYYETESR